jgi:hypothetical protein
MKQRLIVFLMQGMAIQEFKVERASVKYGSIITDMKGKIGGHVAKGGVSGGILQTKASPPRSTSASGKLTKADAGKVIRPQANTSTNAGLWRNLSGSQRDAWIAAAPNYPFLNKFGLPYTPSGYQLYMSVNNNMLAIGEAALNVPPEVSDIEPTPSFTVTDGAGPGLSLLWTGTIPSGYTGVLYASVSQSTGKTLDRGRLKAIALIPDSVGATLDITTAYVAVFGSLPVSGNIWFETKLTKADAGRQSVPYTANFNY